MGPSTRLGAFERDDGGRDGGLFCVRSHQGVRQMGFEVFYTVFYETVYTTGMF